MKDKRIICRGRNGYFNLGTAHVICGAWPEGTSWVEVHSTRIGRQPPIQFRGPRNDLIKLFFTIANVLTTSQGATVNADEIVESPKKNHPAG